MKSYRFIAKIEPVSGGGACIYFPYDVEQEFGTRGRVPVKATIDGVPYTGSLIKYGKPLHMLPILKSIREQLGKGSGDSVAVELEKDASERTIEVPDDLAQALNREGLMDAFEKLSYTHRREYVRWIKEAKREATRAERLAKAVAMLRDNLRRTG